MNDSQKEDPMSNDAQTNNENVLSTNFATPPTEMAANWLTPTNLEAGLRLADLMSKAKLVPQHLQGQPSDCLLVISQAARWGMDPFAVAQSTAVVRGKLCFEGKLVAAAIVATRAVEEGSLDYEFEGEGQNMSIIISGTPRGKDKPKTLRGTVKGWRTENGQWDKDPQSMLVYRGTRQWARLYAPATILGVITPDEIDTEPRAVEGAVVRDGVPEMKAPKQRGKKVEAEAPAELPAPAKAEPDPRYAVLRSECEAFHKAKGSLAAAELRAIAQQLGVAKLTEVAPEKLDHALEMVRKAVLAFGIGATQQTLAG